VSLPPRRTGALPGVPTVGRVARVDYAHLAVALDAASHASAIHFGGSVGLLVFFFLNGS